MSLAIRALALAFSAWPITASVLFAAEPIAVQLASGRTFTGTLDERSNGANLVLTYSAGGVSISRPLAWEKVLEIRTAAEPGAGRKVEIAALREKAAARAANQPALPRPRSISLTGKNEPVRREIIGRMGDPFADEPEIKFGPVRSIRLDAYVANWNATVESDGFVVYVLPLDAAGRLVPVSGTLEVEWIGARRRSFSAVPQSQGLSLERLGYWSTRVMPAEMAAEGIVYQAEFPADHPAFNTSLVNFGLVHVKLSVPGEGVFEASLDGVRLRSFSPVRNQSQQLSRGLFFPNEGTSRGQH